MHPLLAEPTDEQTHLLDVIYKGRELAGWPNFRGADTGGVQRVGGLGRWPIFQYVEAILYQEHKLDARTTLAECPLIAGEGGSYGWTWSARAGAPVTIAPDDELALTVAGMARVPRASNEVVVFLDALAIMIERERSFAPSPTEVQTVGLSLNELSSNLSPPVVDGGGPTRSS